MSFQSFCCVDKKGVLSWANPTAEKVFFMTKQTSDKQDSEQISTSRFVDEIIMESSAESKKGHKKKRTVSGMNGKYN